MKNIIKVFGGALIVATLVINFTTVSQSNKSSITTLSDIELRAEASQENARYAYCQIIGDRMACKNDPTRTCSVDYFCD